MIYGGLLFHGLLSDASTSDVRRCAQQDHCRQETISAYSVIQSSVKSHGFITTYTITTTCLSKQTMPITSEGEIDDLLT